MYREEIPAHCDHPVILLCQKLCQVNEARFAVLQQQHGAAPPKRIYAPFQNLKLHTLDIDLDEVDPRHIEFVNCAQGDELPAPWRAIQVLADILASPRRDQLQAAEAAGFQIVDTWNFDRA
jgi:hypothetical protein